VAFARRTAAAVAACVTALPFFLRPIKGRRFTTRFRIIDRSDSTVGLAIKGCQG